MKRTQGAIILVGYMGCGKSTIGRKLALRLGGRMVDTDKLIEEREGATVFDIFQYEGEERFREIEREVLQQVMADEGVAVISTGGGLPAWRDNMELMNAGGRTVYLKRSAENIASRLSPFGRQKRPRLRGLNDEELVRFMRSDMAARDPYYSRAIQTIACEGMSDDEIIQAIVRFND
ncbi:MAG: shikimate kinase [Rikenellaceae bacterium]|nr:shikimate kinase [Rikenellaceae bacterium]